MMVNKDLVIKSCKRLTVGKRVSESFLQKFPPQARLSEQSRVVRLRVDCILNNLQQVQA